MRKCVKVMLIFSNGDYDELSRWGGLSLDDIHEFVDEKYQAKPKEYWFINSCGVVEVRTAEEQPAVADMHKQFGNYFETKEEAKKALEKLKAYKRLKDKGFAFNGWNWEYQEIGYNLVYTAISEEDVVNAEEDLDVLFEEEEE